MKASVPMSSVRYLLKAVEGQGLDRQSVLESLELTEEEVNQNDSLPA